MKAANTTIMDTADYWMPQMAMAQEYSIWNAAIASLQFWTEDLNPVTLGRATEHVYTTFFYTSTSHTLHASNLMKHCLDVLSYHSTCSF